MPPGQLDPRRKQVASFLFLVLFVCLFVRSFVRMAHSQLLHASWIHTTLIVVSVRSGTYAAGRLLWISLFRARWLLRFSFSRRCSAGLSWPGKEQEVASWPSSHRAVCTACSCDCLSRVTDVFLDFVLTKIYFCESPPKL